MDELDKIEKIMYIVFSIDSVLIIRIYHVFNPPPSIFLHIYVSEHRKWNEVKEDHLLSKRNPIRSISTANKTPKALTKVALFNKKFYSI